MYVRIPFNTFTRLSVPRINGGPCSKVELNSFRHLNRGIFLCIHSTCKLLICKKILVTPTAYCSSICPIRVNFSGRLASILSVRALHLAVCSTHSSSPQSGIEWEGRRGNVQKNQPATRPTQVLPIKLAYLDLRPNK